MTTGPEELSLNYLLDPAFQLVNTAGRPLTNGWIEVYYHGTRNKYYCASDFDGTLHPFRIPLDSLGSNIVLADPNFSYDIYVYNSFGSLQMSRYNVNPGSGSGGGSSGEGGPAEHWSSDTAGGASTTVTGGSTVYLTLPSSEDQPEFVDHTTDTAIFLKEGLYHIDAVVSFKQDDDDLQNIIKDLVVNTGLIGWDAQMTGQKNWTGPESTDDDRHFLELHTVVSVQEDLLQPLYFQISSPVDLDSAAIEKLDIVKLEAGGNGIKYTGGYGIDITNQVISVTGMMPEASAANFVDNSSYQVDIQNIYETIAETSAMIPSGVATEQYVQDYTSAFITQDDLNEYATQEWVVDQGYITSADLPQSVPLVAGEGISIVDTSASTIISVDSAYSPGPSEEWVEEYVSNATSGFITSADIPDIPEDLVTSAELATVSGDIVSQIPSLDGYATQQWVGEQGYLTSVPSEYVTDTEMENYTSAFITSADIPDIPADVVTSGELATVSGEIMNEIPSYTAGSHIDITNNEISVTGVSGLFAGENVTITTSAGNYYINSIGGGSGSDVDIIPTIQTGTKIADYVIDGTSGELYAPDGGSTYTAGDNISIVNDEISVSGTAGLIAGNNISITPSEEGYVISSTGGGDVPADVVTSGQLATVSGEIMNEIPDMTGYATSGDLATVSGQLSRVSTYAQGSSYPFFPVQTNYKSLRFNYGSTGTPETSGVRRIVEVSDGGSTYTTLGELVPVPPTSGLVLTSLASSGMSWQEPSGGGSVTFPLEVSGSTNVYEARDGLTSGYVNAGEIYVGYHGGNDDSPFIENVTITSDKVEVKSYRGGAFPARSVLNSDHMDFWDEEQSLQTVDYQSIENWNNTYDAVDNSAAYWNSAYNAINSSASNWNDAAGMNEYPISAGPGMSIEDVDGVTVFSCTGGEVPADVVTSGQLATVSGNIMNEIPDLTGYATQTWVSDGFMETSGLEFNSQDEISGYNGHPVMTVDSEKQWLTHDDTIAHVTNSAQYAFGVNVPVVAQAMGTDETVLYTGNGSSVVLSEVATNFEYLEITWEHKQSASLVNNMVFKYEIPTTEFMGYGGRGQSQETGGFVWFMATWRLGSDNKTLTRWMSRYMVIGDTGIGTPTASNNLYPIKIVGIGRKEN